MMLAVKRSNKTEADVCLLVVVNFELLRPMLFMLLLYEVSSKRSMSDC